MNKIVLNNKNLTFIAKDLGEEFNKVEFLHWYAQINPSFRYVHEPMNSGAIHKYFSKSKEYLKVFDLPDLEINNEKDFKNFLAHPHGKYREPLIKLLRDEFGINYWEETLQFACEDRNLSYSAYYGLLSHSMNDWEFTEKNIDKIKKFIDVFVDSINNTNNKRFSEVLQYIAFAIPNKEVFGNSWLVATLNQIFKYPDDGSSKSFSFQVDKLSPQFMDLDFSGVSLYPELKKVLKGKLPVTKSGDNTKVFFIEIDIPRYCMQHKTVQQMLHTNCITGFDIIDKYLNDETDVLSHFVKRDKNKISLSVIHDDPKLNDKLNILVDTILNNTQLNKIVDKSDFEKALIYINLNDTMEIKNIKTKIVKV